MGTYWHIVFLSLIPGMASSNNIPSHFWKTIDSLDGPGGAALRGKIYFGMETGNSILQDRMFRNPDQDSCYEKLHRIMRDDLKCPRAANEIKPFLDIIEFRHNMIKDERFVQSFYQRNCTWLGGRSEKMCDQGKINVKYETFIKLFEECHLEQMEPAARENASLLIR